MSKQMKPLIGKMALLVVASLATVQLPAAEPYPHFGGKFIATRYAKRLAFFDNGKLVTELPLPNPKCGEPIGIFYRLPNGNFLVTMKYAVQEFTPAGEIVFDYNHLASPARSPSWCRRLENGNTLIAETGEHEMREEGDRKVPVKVSGPRVVEVSPEGAVLSTVELEFDADVGKKGYSRYQMRGVCQLENGHFVAAHQAARMVNEYAPDGKLVRTVLKTQGGPFSVFPCANGNIVIGTMEGKQAGVYEVDQNGTIVWQFTYDDAPPEAQWQYITDVKKTETGNYLVLQHHGHNPEWAGFPLMEISPDKKVVRAYTDTKTLRDAMYFCFEK